MIFLDFLNLKSIVRFSIEKHIPHISKLQIENIMRDIDLYFQNKKFDDTDLGI